MVRKIMMTSPGLFPLRWLSRKTTMPYCTKRVVMARLNRDRSIDTIRCKDGCIDYSTLMSLSLKLSNSWRAPTELAMLADSYTNTMLVMSSMLNQVGMVHYTLEIATEQNERSYSLLKIPTNPLAKNQILSNSAGNGIWPHNHIMISIPSEAYQTHLDSCLTGYMAWTSPGYLSKLLPRHN